MAIAERLIAEKQVSQEPPPSVTVEIPPALRSLSEITQPHQLILALKTYARAGRSFVVIPPGKNEIAIQSEALLRWADTLGSLDPQRLDWRLQKIKDTIPGITTTPQALPRLLGSKLIKAGVPKPQAQQEGARLLGTLENFIRKEEPAEVAKEIPPRILTNKDLEHAQLLVSTVEFYGSVAQQLMHINWPQLVRAGLNVNTEIDNWIHGGALPSALLKILRALRYEKSAEVLRNWIYQQATEQPKECVQLLESTASFFLFLDQPSLIRLLASESNNDTLQLLPFHSLRSAVEQAIAYLNSYPAYEGFVGNLENVQEAIKVRFAQIVEGPLRDQLTASAVEALTPSFDNLAQQFLEWVKRQSHDNTPQNTRDFALTALRMLEQAGARDLEAFCTLIGKAQPQIAHALRKEAVRFALLPDSKRQLTKEIVTDTLQTLKNHPWIDAAEINFAESGIVNEQTTKLKVVLAPGTFVFHHGHWDTLQRLLDWSTWLDKLDPKEAKHTETIVLYMPIPKVYQAPGYTKNWWEVGHIYERALSIMIGLAQEDRRKVLMTTRLQEPNAQGASHNIAATIRNLGIKLKENPETVHIKLEPFLVLGDDELNWARRKNGDGRELLPEKRQPKKVRPSILKDDADILPPSSFCAARWGSLVDITDAFPLLSQVTNVKVVNLAPSRENTSSSEMIERARKGDFSKMPATLAPLARRFYSQNAVDIRLKYPPDSDIPSITEIYYGAGDFQMPPSTHGVLEAMLRNPGSYPAVSGLYESILKEDGLL